MVNKILSRKLATHKVLVLSKNCFIMNTPKMLNLQLIYFLYAHKITWCNLCCNNNFWIVNLQFVLQLICMDRNMTLKHICAESINLIMKKTHEFTSFCRKSPFSHSTWWVFRIISWFQLICFPVCNAYKLAGCCPMVWRAVN